MTSDQRMLMHMVRLGIVDSAEPATYCDVDWSAVMDMSYRQSVMALALDGFQKYVGSGSLANLSIAEEKALLRQWMMKAVKVEASYTKRSSIVDEFKTYGVPFSILKGLSFSQYYPVPEHREGGDIDIFAAGDGFEKLNSIFESKDIKVDKRIRLHSQFMYNGLLVENHRALSPESKRLNNYMEGLLQDSWNNVYPSDEFNAILCIQHARKHFLTEGGITLKIIADWVLIRKTIDRESFSEVIGRYGLRKFYRPFDEVADLLEGVVNEDELSGNAKELIDAVFKVENSGPSHGADSFIAGKFRFVRGVVRSRQKFRKFNDVPMIVYVARMSWHHFFNI